MEHDKRGTGIVTDIDEENECVFVKYEGGDEHRYDQLSLGSGKMRVLGGATLQGHRLETRLSSHNPLMRSNNLQMRGMTSLAE